MHARGTITAVDVVLRETFGRLCTVTTCALKFLVAYGNNVGLDLGIGRISRDAVGQDTFEESPNRQARNLSRGNSNGGTDSDSVCPPYGGAKLLMQAFHRARTEHKGVTFEPHLGTDLATSCQPVCPPIHVVTPHTQNNCSSFVHWLVFLWTRAVVVSLETPGSRIPSNCCKPVGSAFDHGCHKIRAQGGVVDIRATVNSIF